MDEGIHALAEKKLRLDAAVLDGITASSKQSKAADNLAMSELLQNLIAGKPHDIACLDALQSCTCICKRAGHYCA